MDRFYFGAYGKARYPVLTQLMTKKRMIYLALTAIANSPPRDT